MDSVEDFIAKIVSDVNTTLGYDGGYFGYDVSNIVLQNLVFHSYTDSIPTPWSPRFLGSPVPATEICGELSSSTGLQEPTLDFKTSPGAGSSGVVRTHLFQTKEQC
ncbi:hypothetical protein TNIN_408701 [Trichonephila inaurata madagascariensis]|uniref:Uncharacterized protein n=1 Tax=Trichonephila inaurata madagascariensis TaxID=2747483 RepID=A0A8X6WSN6_9ARAC|nr:hypothetical protein TNIN_408701 [Trichonephila inaurata madagascariensis]